MTFPLEATPEHKALHELEGDWSIKQKMWVKPGAEPVHNAGRYSCRILMNGLAILQSAELSGPLGKYLGVGLATWNIQQKRYETAWLDNMTQHGFIRFEGQTERKMSATVHGLGGPATQERVWQTRTLEAGFVGPRSKELAARAKVGGDKGIIPMRLVENRVSADAWVAEFHAKTEEGEVLLLQNEYSRVASQSESLQDTVMSAFALRGSH
jgi:hypothetical protein